MYIKPIGNDLVVINASSADPTSLQKYQNEGGAHQSTSRVSLTNMWSLTFLAGLFLAPLFTARLAE
jgi:hypothetical protein